VALEKALIFGRRRTNVRAQAAPALPSFDKAAASSRTSGFMKNVPPEGVMLTCTPNDLSSDATIGPTAATKIRLKP
jgi:hypothetical protein